MAAITQAELEMLLDLPPSYESLFGPSEEKTDGNNTPPVEDSEASNELRAQEEAEARRLSNNQNRYMVSDTRANPPEAPHFLAPDLRPWMRNRSDAREVDTDETQELNHGQTVINTRGTSGRRNDRMEINRPYRSDETTRPRANPYAAEMALYPQRRTNPFAAEMLLYPQRQTRALRRSNQRYRSERRGCTVD